ncbi:MAG: nucleotidyl transferase AbiEii/AbiGii toxin family protein [Myxococcota bacterium]|nr:nucleotidyl transferase AbiEii/AbiGii toxin family protein [Myxococcota bacterium]
MRRSPGAEHDAAARRHRAQEGLLLRVARREPEAFALRGGMRMRQLTVARERPALDVDLVWRGGADSRGIAELLRGALADDQVGDGVELDPARLRVDAMQGPRGLMGYRAITPARVDGVGVDLRVDLRTDLQIWPPPRVERFRATTGEAWLAQCAPETLLGRKVQVIVEAGTDRWRAKDLLDVSRLLSGQPLDDAIIERACADAFATVGSSLEAARDVWASPDLLGGRRARLRWRRAGGARTLDEVVAGVRRRLAPILGGGS